MNTRYVGKLPIYEFNRLTNNGEQCLAYAAHVAETRTSFVYQLLSIIAYAVDGDYKTYIRDLRDPSRNGVVVERSNPNFVYLHIKIIS